MFYSGKREAGPVFVDKADRLDVLFMDEVEVGGKPLFPDFGIVHLNPLNRIGFCDHNRLGVLLGKSQDSIAFGSKIVSAVSMIKDGNTDPIDIIVTGVPVCYTIVLIGLRCIGMPYKGNVFNVFTVLNVSRNMCIPITPKSSKRLWSF